eukprot:2221149-Amphidinium_carterae.1
MQEMEPNEMEATTTGTTTGRSFALTTSTKTTQYQPSTSTIQNYDHYNFDLHYFVITAATAFTTIYLDKTHSSGCADDNKQDI